jgi:hypothetical protein
MYIQKIGKKKDAIRINSEKDIPDFLKDTVEIKDGQVWTHTAEGVMSAPVGKIFGFEKSEVTGTGYGAWCIADESRVKEVDGVFYAAPKVTEAEIISDDIPDWLKNSDKLTKNDDGSYSLQTDWGISKGEPGQALFVKYGVKEDGSIDANILTMSEPSFFDYMLCTEDGQDIMPLSKYVDELKLNALLAEQSRFGAEGGTPAAVLKDNKGDEGHDDIGDDDGAR